MFLFWQHYSHFLRASQNYPDVTSGVAVSGADLTADDSAPENDLDSCNLPLNLVATQLGGSDSSQHWLMMISTWQWFSFLYTIILLFCSVFSFKNKQLKNICVCVTTKWNDDGTKWKKKMNKFLWNFGENCWGGN